MTKKGAVNFTSGWASLSDNRKVGITKVGRIVYLSGIAQKSTATANGDVMLTLPAGFRPSADIYGEDGLICQTPIGQQAIGTNSGTIAIHLDGRIATRSTAPAGWFAAFDSISFVAD